MTHVDRPRAIAAVTEQFEALDDLTAALGADDWHRPTCLAGWDVQANIAHVIGTEAMLLGEATPAVAAGVSTLPHVRNAIAEFNEAWVIALADATPEELRTALRDRIDRRLAALEATSDADWDKEGFTPAGTDTYGRYVRIRVMDMWMHEQDVREAVDTPGHTGGGAVDLALDEMEGALGYVVGKRAGAPAGTSVRFELTGDAGRTIDVAVDGRAAVVPALPGPATTTITMPVLTFTRLAGGRTTDTSGVDISGDLALGAQVADHLAFMI